MSEGNPAEVLKTVFGNCWENKFLTEGSKSYTYAQFFSKALNFSKVLESSGLSQGGQLCIMLPNSSDSLALYLASALLGVSIAPIDINRGKKEAADIFSQLNPDIIISETGAEKQGSRSITLDSLRKKAAEGSPASIEDLENLKAVEKDKLFLITFTSGSTGKPKGVKHSLYNLVATAQAFRSRFNFNSEHAFYHNLPMAYMAGILNLFFLPLISGSRIVLGKRFSIESIPTFWETPAKEGVNVFFFVPTTLVLLLKLDRGAQGIEYAATKKITGCVATAPLPKKVQKEFEEKYSIPLYESYGLSETLFVSTMDPSLSGEGVGKPLDGVELGFRPDSEITIKVPWMYLGYTNVDESEYFSGDKYLSGDLGELSDSGVLKITGRKKDLIIRGGSNISPRRIEEFVDSTGIAAECAVVGVQNEVLGEKIICFVSTGEGNNSPDFQELKHKISEALGKEYAPDGFKVLEEIPKNINGKVDKLRLRQICTEGDEK